MMREEEEEESYWLLRNQPMPGKAWEVLAVQSPKRSGTNLKLTKAWKGLATTVEANLFL